MNRRDALKAAGASVFAGTALTTSGAADRREVPRKDKRREREPPTGDGVRVVAVETERTDEDRTDEYSVDYKGDNRVEITGYTTASNPCHEIQVADIESTEYGDVVDLELVYTGAEVCATVIADFRYTVELEYKSERLVDDVFVQIPDGLGRN